MIRTRSPSSLKLAFRLLREGKALSRGDCLKMEYRVGARRVMDGDFREGVRAVLIDKDGLPRWRPAMLAEVQEADIAGYFDNLGARELSFSGTGRGLFNYLFAMTRLLVPRARAGMTIRLHFTRS